jgi:hypothetical protein
MQIRGIDLAQGSAIGKLALMTQPRRRHLLIAGTGRAGTSFLVRFLTGLGLETHISRLGESAWDEAAQAGFEDLPLSALSSDLPHVMKQPWSFLLIDQILVDPEIELEAVVIPMRGLVESATSRMVVEIRAMHERAPWMAKLQNTFDNWGQTPGGVIFSLNPIDQSRLLAVGFHRLLEQLVRSDVPIIFLSFPKLIQDADYLFRKLRSVLPAEITLERAQQIHAKIADLKKVRVEGELLAENNQMARSANGTDVPSFEKLDNIALRRELHHIRVRLALAEAANLANSESSKRSIRRRVMDRCCRMLRATKTRLEGFTFLGLLGAGLGAPETARKAPSKPPSPNQITSAAP